MESVDASEKVKERSVALWNALLTETITPESALLESRRVQDLIYEQRCREQQVFEWVYSRFRSEQEEDMKVGAEALVAEYERGVARGGAAQFTD